MDEYKEVEYFMDDSITVAPAEEIPIDGTTPMPDFEEIQKKKKKRGRKKKVVTEVKVEAGIEDEIPIKEVKKQRKTRAKKVEAKAVEKKQIKPKSQKKQRKVRTKIEKEEIIPVKEVEQKVEPEIKVEDNNVKGHRVSDMDADSVSDMPGTQGQDYHEDSSGAKYLGMGILALIIIIALIFGISYITNDKLISGVDPSGNVVNVITTDSYTYNGFEFSKSNVGLWYTTVNVGSTEYMINLHYSPKEVENIPLEGDIDESYQDITDLYVTFDPEGEHLKYVALSIGELGTNMNNAFNIGLVGSCTVNKTNACADREIITCDNTDKPVVYFKEAEGSKVIMDGNCIIVQGLGEDILKSTERLLYNLYGIIL
ncbi:hypothetical protein KY330_02955 [Candidatus Woesearchaeota archaeon]|nr:hypothetical protein [Candidatus Woesearchaeota archaeon]